MPSLPQTPSRSRADRLAGRRDLSHVLAPFAVLGVMALLCIAVGEDRPDREAPGTKQSPGFGARLSRSDAAAPRIRPPRRASWADWSSSAAEDSISWRLSARGWGHRQCGEGQGGSAATGEASAGRRSSGGGAVKKRSAEDDKGGKEEQRKSREEAQRKEEEEAKERRDREREQEEEKKNEKKDPEKKKDKKKNGGLSIDLLKIKKEKRKEELEKQQNRLKLLGTGGEGD